MQLYISGGQQLEKRSRPFYSPALYATWKRAAKRNRQLPVKLLLKSSAFRGKVMNIMAITA
jgi:hypothetical protein